MRNISFKSFWALTGSIRTSGTFNPKTNQDQNGMVLNLASALKWIIAVCQSIHLTLQMIFRIIQCAKAGFSKYYDVQVGENGENKAIARF
ncbi:MAG: hypothetical protein HQM08_05810 [Candidatus Riflebacteria bacterium]|nr:hypothetical protein [Candidatus Riflebacteria bacterium]